MEKRARLNKAMRDRLGAWGEPYQIHTLGERPYSAYGMTLAPEQIAFEAITEEGES